MFDVFVGKDKRKRKLVVDLSVGGNSRFKRDGRRKKTFVALKELVEVVKSTRDALMVAVRPQEWQAG